MEVTQFNVTTPIASVTRGGMQAFASADAVRVFRLSGGPSWVFEGLFNSSLLFWGDAAPLDSRIVATAIDGAAAPPVLLVSRNTTLGSYVTVYELSPGYGVSHLSLALPPSAAASVCMRVVASFRCALM